MTGKARLAAAFGAGLVVALALEFAAAVTLEMIQASYRQGAIDASMSALRDTIKISRPGG